MHMHGPINYILFGGFPARQMPVVLPHDLVSAMAKAGIWPSQIGKAGVPATGGNTMPRKTIGTAITQLSLTRNMNHCACMGMTHV